MPLNGASAARADIVYPRLNVTVDTGAGIDVRNLDDVNGATNDATTTATALATNDNVERTFDPATGGVTNTNNAGTTLFRLGWAFPVVDMEIQAGDQDTACNAVITAQTLNALVNMSLTWSSSIADPATGTVAITFRASLWRYNPSTDAGVLIAAGSVATPTWNIAVAGGDAKGTFKQATIPIIIPAGGIEFSAGEVLFLQVGFNTGTLPNPLSGTTTYTFALQVDSNSTKIDFAAAEGIRQQCVFTTNVVGEGLSPLAIKATTMARTATGEGLASLTKVAAISKVFSLAGEGVVTRTLNVGIPRTIVGEGLVSMTRVVIASKSFTILGEGLVSPAILAITLARTATGEGLVSFTKAVIAGKTFDIVGEGLVSMTKNTQAQRTFNLIGEGIATRTLAVAIPRTAIGEGLVSITKTVIANKTFTILGEGLVSRVLDIIEEFDLIGEGLVTFTKSTQAQRTFSLVGKGLILISGPNASTITIPIDEVPEGGGGGTIIVVKKPVFVFDD